MPSSSIVSATPGFVAGTFDAQDVRLATLGNSLPGKFASSDFAVTQRAAGANMSVDIAAGRAFVDPQAATHQGLYLPRMESTFNTSSDGGLTWTAADATNPRIDLLCIEVADTDFAGAYTGWKFRVVDGTASASATHQLEANVWPSIPTGLLPIAAIRIPAAATTITTANITNLNSLGGRGAPSETVATAEATSSTSYVRLATAHHVLVYVPHAGAAVRIGYQAHVKMAASSGTQNFTFFIDGVQLKKATASGAPAVAEYAVAGTSTGYSHLTTRSDGSLFFQTPSSLGSDSTDVTTGMMTASSVGTDVGHITVFGLPAGWHIIEPRMKTSASTLTARNRYLWAEVIG